MMNLFDIKGKKAIVTGGTRGLSGKINKAYRITGHGQPEERERHFHVPFSAESEQKLYRDVRDFMIK